jgi:pyruvate-ferredoxin/flavodoxin oxidoreductase
MDIRSGRIIIIMGSGYGPVHEVTDYLNDRVKRLDMFAFTCIGLSPSVILSKHCRLTVKKIAVLDRCKEPGAIGEPHLYGCGNGDAGTWS